MPSDTNLQPAVVVIYKAMADKVREVASELSLPFEEEAVLGHANALRFRFAPMDGATSSKLALAIPREAFVKRAVFE